MPDIPSRVTRGGWARGRGPACAAQRVEMNHLGELCRTNVARNASIATPFEPDELISPPCVALACSSGRKDVETNHLGELCRTRAVSSNHRSWFEETTHEACCFRGPPRMVGGIGVPTTRESAFARGVPRRFSEPRLMVPRNDRRSVHRTAGELPNANQSMSRARSRSFPIPASSTFGIFSKRSSTPTGSASLCLSER
jgi:hypothetical protein